MTGANIHYFFTPTNYQTILHFFMFLTEILQSQNVRKIKIKIKLK